MLPPSTQAPVSTATPAPPLPWSPATHVAWLSLLLFYFTMVEGSWGEGYRVTPHPGPPLLPCTKVLAAYHNVFRPEPGFYTQRHPHVALWADGQRGASGSVWKLPDLN